MTLQSFPVIVRRLLLAMALTAVGLGCVSSAEPPPSPQRVLITNDDGIADSRIAVLARAFANAGAEVWVVAADADRSGYSNFTPATRSGRYRVRPHDLGAGVRACELQGAPADCVLFALTGPMRDSPPTLVVSGPNGGANAGDDWFGSGTVGAARTAAYLGIPAIAVSGFAEFEPEAERIAADWVVALTRHRVVRSLAPQQYLTISFPETPLHEVRGVEIVRRAQRVLAIETAPRGTSEGWEEWALSASAQPPHEDTDVAALARGHIAIVPMIVGDVDEQGLRALLRRRDTPTWTTNGHGATARTP